MKDVREQEGFLERRNYQQQFLPEWKEPGILRKTANNASSFASFPTKAHIVTYGRPRTGTTLLFNMVGVSYFLHLLRSDPEAIETMQLKFWKWKENSQHLKPSRILNNAGVERVRYVIKTHMSLDYFRRARNLVVFSTASSRDEAEAMMEKEHNLLAFVQDLETLKDDGIEGLVKHYSIGYGLSMRDQRLLIEYFKSWEILRQCCGKQMSSRHRNDMLPSQFKVSKIGNHPFCGEVDIDEVEGRFMNTTIYKMIEKYSNIQALNRPSLKDEALNRTYCSSYNNLVRTQGLNIWGTPGGRPVRSKLDQALKKEYAIGALGLDIRFHDLFEIEWKELLHRTTDEKVAWLEKVIDARGENKTLSDYKITPTIRSDQIRSDDTESTYSQVNITRTKLKRMIKWEHAKGTADIPAASHHLINNNEVNKIMQRSKAGRISWLDQVLAAKNQSLTDHGIPLHVMNEE